MSAKLPESSRFQCPACGAPVTVASHPYQRVGSTWAILLEDCGHVVSLDLIRDSWGVSVPEPQVLWSHPDSR